MASKEKEFVIVVDTETSGLPHDQRARTLEVAFIVLDDNYNFIDAAQMYVNPSIWTVAWGAAFKIHGLSPGFLAEQGRPESEALALLNSYEEKYKQPRWTSFNKRFDLEFLRRLDFTPAREAECIMSLSAAAMQLNKRTVAMVNALASLHPQFKYDKTQAHKAGYDAYAAAELYVKIRKEFIKE